MSCALRCKAVSPPKLDDPRRNGSRSEGIHRATTPRVSGVVSGPATVRPSSTTRRTFGETLVTPIADGSATHGTLGLMSPASPCGAGSRRAQLPRRTLAPLPKHPEEHRPKRPVLLAIDQQLA